MAADPGDLVDAIKDIRESVRLYDIGAISNIEKKTLIVIAAQKACNALTKLYEDGEFWSMLRDSGVVKALELVDLTIVDDELNRHTIHKISDFMIALGMPKHEAYEFVSVQIKLIKRSIEENAYPQRKTIDMAYSATDNLRREVCDSAEANDAELERMRIRRWLGGEVLNRSIGAITGSVFSFLSTIELSERLPEEARIISNSLTNKERLSIFKLFYASLSSEMMPPPSANEMLIEG